MLMEIEGVSLFLHFLFSGIAGGLVVATATFAVEKLGGLWGGIIAYVTNN